MRISTGYLFRAQHSEGVSHHGLVETQRQAEEWESFTVVKREGSVCPAERLLAVGILVVGGLTRSRYPV